MRYQPQRMISFTATLSNGKTVKVTAPSEQRAHQRVTKWLADQESELTVTSITRD
ncbi:hypothetical protein ABZ357_21330 [Streptomyces sp. NPDC005917]|uniref:hypothetical protein n=1 Tax=unclassified Streptomyces TaxID=2593676 RepID=UPI0033CD7AB7